MDKYNSIIKTLKKNRPAFDLVNMNDRPVFIRPLYTQEGEECRYCNKKAIAIIHEIDKSEHYADWYWCGNLECDAG